jgi:thiamine-monophosphate kinase
MLELFEADDGLQYALAGGDDYELLFTLPPEQAAAVLGTLQLQQRVTQIGVMTESDSAAVQCLRNGQPFRIRRTGYDHFAAGEQGS